MTIFKNSDDIFTSYVCTLPVYESKREFRVLKMSDIPYEIREEYHSSHGDGKFMYDGGYDVYDGIRYVSVDTQPATYVVLDESEACDIEYHITLREKGRIMHELATYITNYLTEEQARNPSFEISQSMIFNAIEAYEGGAR